MTFKCTGWICKTSSSDSHSGQLRISPSSTSSSSTSISAEHSGQRITAPSSVQGSKSALLTPGAPPSSVLYTGVKSTPSGRPGTQSASLQEGIKQLVYGVFAGISGASAGGSGRRDRRRGTGTADPAGQRTAAGRVVNTGRNAGVGGDAGTGRGAGTAGGNRADGEGD